MVKKRIKKIVIIVIVIILLDSIQAFIFNNNPLIKVIEYYNDSDIDYKSKGILVNTYNCNNGIKDTTIKGFSYSCSYMGGKYVLIDKTKEINDFVCALTLESFYEDDTYIYYWKCIKNNYMVVRYDNGKEELISKELVNGHIDIEILDKFGIDYIKYNK